MYLKDKIKQSFACAAENYDKAASLQRQVGRALWQQLGELPDSISLLDLGCGTGFMVADVIERQQALPRHCVALDIAEPMLAAAKIKLAKLNPDVNMTYLCADAEALPLSSACVDVAVSNLTLQWCQNLDTAFAEIRRVLVPGGRLAFTTFGSETLQELREAWKKNDNYQHINNFYPLDKLGRLIKQAGFSVNKLATHHHQVKYSTVYDLLRELKQLGASTVMSGHNPSLTGKVALQTMIEAYPQTQDGQIMATFEVITIIAESNG